VGKFYLFLVCVGFGAFLGRACDLARFNVGCGLLWVGECVAAILRVNMCVAAAVARPECGVAGVKRDGFKRHLGWGVNVNISVRLGATL